MLLKALEMGSKYPNLTKKISDYMKRCEYLADSIGKLVKFILLIEL